MAIQRYKIDGYGQVELNNCAFRRDGRIESQCARDDSLEYVENGMILAVDKVNRTVKYVQDNTLPYALNYTSEHLYDEQKNGLKDFRLGQETFLPRLGYLSVGDSFTTNCICYDTEEYTNDEAVDTALKAYKTTPVYGTVSNIGAVKLTKTAPQGLALIAMPATMPDGSFGVKFHTRSAQ